MKKSNHRTASELTASSHDARKRSEPDDYALREYGVTEKELDRFVKRMHKQIAHEREAGTMKRYTGDLESDIEN